MTIRCLLFLLSHSLFIGAVEASQGATCSSLSGVWESPDNSHSYVMYISSDSVSCGSNCTLLRVKYKLDADQENNLFCYEGEEGIIGSAPLVLAFEGAYGGHSVGTYNNQLKKMWTGVIPKNSGGNWIPQMDSYWFSKEEESLVYGFPLF
ncbi:hypothetical protein [Vibrio navarrensis]|uniref:hypothetical protein n=1 Tax=Vibrio navarrensis TaxID=29495 RepID=UPI00155994AF|nr:hypothetical protein [Vibrio navarrensis]